MENWIITLVVLFICLMQNHPNELALELSSAYLITYILIKKKRTSVH